jgi:hypothetical protein
MTRTKERRVRRKINKSARRGALYSKRLPLWGWVSADQLRAYLLHHWGLT